ncbi:BREX-2 system adenine-specific DNA-methyltransferase PglX [Actinomadura hibisca]|uniref:BREX-2 system adenine-specific DNA-methyltransferase PglX n=1 Tax=Actinomadura hibisca TaxID=68565 RepID=UPI000836CF0D|nr:BREX-2 system adenine-specific DNA-methyltransferase PglX [Actinomadura hibisca]
MAVDHVALLKDLRKQVLVLEDDLRERTESEAEFRDKLQGEYDRALEAKRTAATYGPWRDERVTQAAVAWVLATVFVRFCEDNGLIAEAWIAGPGERLLEADERHQAFFKKNPQKNDRDWLIESFDHLAETNETVAGLFDEDHNPLWELEPSYEAASELLKFWRRTGPDGAIVHDFTDAELNTRFLGDLYQDLSDHAKKTYALLQTPEFVEEFILDLTLEPAVEEFGLEPVWRHKPKGWPGTDPTVRGLRTIDPACGSGHFLLGIFHRLLRKWEDAAPNVDRWELIRRTLESVHGCDKNPFAAEIARFRLLIAALYAAGEKRLDRVPTFPINVAVGDSLLHGRDAENVTGQLWGDTEQFTYRTEDVQSFAARCDLLGKHSYHVVVGNPPYITVKDENENSNYRKYEAVGGAYALSVPFAERIFELAITPGGAGRSAGYTGQITANSFMKREFGKKLIRWFYERVDVTHVIDTSGAYIPGHGTPTVILIGRNRMAYANATIRVVQGICGEPAQPKNASEGSVWQSIVRQTPLPGSESDWVSVVDVERTSLSTHPWSLSGGGSSEMQSLIEGAAQETLGNVAKEIGAGAVTREDSAYMVGAGTLRRHRIPKSFWRALVEGDVTREWRIADPVMSVWPYDAESLRAHGDPAVLTFLWPYKVNLRERIAFGKSQIARKLTWFEYSMFFRSRYKNPLSIAYGEIATHNHFALDRGGRVFNRTAPVIKLPDETSEEEYLGLLGLLNSSTACFWLRQVSHKKGGSVGSGGGDADQPWSWTHQFNASKVGKFPIARQKPIDLAKIISLLADGLDLLEVRISDYDALSNRDSLNDVQFRRGVLRRKMISLQEELDWQVYGFYGLLGVSDRGAFCEVDAIDLPEVELGERPFEIVLARRVVAGEADSEWFRRHGSTPVTEIPERWPEEYRRVVQARIDLIEKQPRGIGLLERPEYKRRWADEPWEKKERAALRTWILDRCERKDLWFRLRDGFEQPRTLTVAQLADQFRNDEDMQNVAALYATDHLNKRDLPLAQVLAEVIADEHVPYLAALRYTDTGLRKREEWEQTWEKQREEDRTGTRLDIAVPPKYAPKDFKKNSYWSHRGKLDVPKERFISYPGASPDADSSLLLGWAGWDHKDQAQALVNLVNDRTEQAGWESEKLKPLLAGLLEVLPWVHQWHGEHDSEWGGVPAEEFQAFLDDQCTAHRFSERNLRDWQPPAATRGRKKQA